MAGPARRHEGDFLKRITSGNELLALIISPDDFVPGVNFVSEPAWPFQLGMLMHSEGHTISPHRHLLQPDRVIPSTQELLLVVSGQMEVDFYDSTENYCCTEVLQPGEALLHVQGGHGFRFPKTTQVIELKQGPYAGRAQDKEEISQAATPTAQH